MKRLGLFFALMMLMVAGIGTASASEMTMDLPQGVKTLIEQTYPTHQLEGVWGSGNEEQGMFALSLSVRVEEWKEFILCIAKKSQGDTAYTFTIEGGSTPQMHVEPSAVEITENELVITYFIDNGIQITNRYVMQKDAQGAWTLVSGTNTEVYSSYVDDIEVYKQITTELSIKDGMLEYLKTVDNEQQHYAPVPFGESFEQYFLLSNFNGEFPLTPFAFNNGRLDALIDTSLVAQGEELKQAVLQVDELILVVKLADDLEQFRFCAWDKAAKTYHVENCKPTAIDLNLDTYHFGEWNLGLHQYSEIDRESYHGFIKTAQGKWRLSSIQGLGNIRFGLNYADGHNGAAGQNDGYLYGKNPWDDILRVDFDALPTTMADVIAQMDQSDYALVSNPTPDTRLNIRTDPHSDAATRGKLYNRAPVYIKEIMGDWVHIGVGDENGLDGYVMKKYLAFGDEKETVICAFPSMVLKEEREQQPIYAEPSERAEIISWASWYDHFIIGVYGDDWYIVMTKDGVVGYVPQASYWAGNG